MPNPPALRGFNLDEQDRPELDVAAARILAEAIDAALAALPPPAPSGEGEFIIAAAETVETADSVIQIMGDDVPEEWNTAYLAFCAARAALHAPAPSVPPGVGAVPGWPTGITHGELSDIRYGRTAPLPPGVVELKEAAEEVAHWLEALSGIVDWPDDGEPDLKALNCDAVLSMAMKGGRQTCNALRAAIAAVPIGG